MSPFLLHVLLAWSLVHDDIDSVLSRKINALLERPPWLNLIGKANFLFILRVLTFVLQIIQGLVRAPALRC